MSERVSEIQKVDEKLNSLELQFAACANSDDTNDKREDIFARCQKEREESAKDLLAKEAGELTKLIGNSGKAAVDKETKDFVEDIDRVLDLAFKDPEKRASLKMEAIDAHVRLLASYIDAKKDYR